MAMMTLPGHQAPAAPAAERAAPPWFGARWLRGAVIGAVRLYQVTLSRALPSSCRFYPSCSHYMMEAVRVHGVLRGVAMGLWRICRCNPFSPGGDDPVPAKRPKRARPRE